ncbi:hypothetical protein GYQ39_05225 [Lactococcus piscium]|uniref:hypothetical protein n=1 Tax=Pseudolactococcus carnosus TaxID=2749961 RepID=UPI001FBB3D38|nr:hypothetical protein [Lactococcus carnosus]MCJ2000328.1 hypothetical protein [Lactococcus carnosus]
MVVFISKKGDDMLKLKKIAMLTVAVATLGTATVGAINAAAENPHPWLIDQWDHSSKNGSTNAYSNYSVLDARLYGSIAYVNNRLGVTRSYDSEDYGMAYSSHKQDKLDLGTKSYPGWNVYYFGR